RSGSEAGRARPARARAPRGCGGHGHGLEIRFVGGMGKAPAGIAAGGAARENDVVAHPQRGDAALVSLAREPGERLAVRERTLIWKMTADVHRALLFLRRAAGGHPRR